MNSITMRGHLKRCWLFTWREPAKTVATLLPAPLELVEHGGFAFWNVVVCEITGMRPAFLPEVVGLGYWHVAYRLHARVHLRSGETVEGLYFVRSDCDRHLLSLAGNCFTDFRFHTAGIDVSESGGVIEGAVRSHEASAQFRLLPAEPPSLAPGSPFASVGAAAAFLKYKPFALTPADGGEVSILRVVRRESDWRSRIVSVGKSHWQFFADRDVAPEVCYDVEPIDYEWRRFEVHPVAS